MIIASNSTLANGDHATGPVHAIGAPWQNRGPIRNMIKREVRIRNRVPDRAGLGLLAGAFIAWTGLFWFQTARKGFADVL